MITYLDFSSQNDSELEAIEWDEENNSWKFTSTNELLTDEEVYGLIAEYISRFESEMIEMTNQMLERTLDFSDWQYQMSAFIRLGHVALLHFGMGGKQNTNASDYIFLSKKLKEIDYPALFKFANEIKWGKLSAKAIVARVKLYARAARFAFEYAINNTMQAIGYNESRRKLSRICSPHCKECVTYASWGWVGLNQLILPTQQCSCGVNCCCSVEYRKV